MKWHEDQWDEKNQVSCEKCGKALYGNEYAYMLVDTDHLFDWPEDELIAKFGVAEPWADFGYLCHDCLEKFDPNYRIALI